MKGHIFWDVTPCSALEVNRRFGGRRSFHLQGRRIRKARNQHEVGSKQSSYVSYSSTLKMETCSLEMSNDLQRPTWCYIKVQRVPHNHCYENLKSHISKQYVCECDQ
jgi:hypothetical protein